MPPRGGDDIERQVNSSACTRPVPRRHELEVVELARGVKVTLVRMRVNQTPLSHLSPLTIIGSRETS